MKILMVCKENSCIPSSVERSAENAVAPLPRIRRADRQQLDPQPRRLDELIDGDHPARVVWEFVEGLDLGVRVRASAGAGSFRRNRTLEKCLHEAEAHMEALRREWEENPAVAYNRRQAAQARAARERQGRVKAALELLAEVETKKKPMSRKQPAEPLSLRALMLTPDRWRQFWNKLDRFGFPAAVA